MFFLPPVEAASDMLGIYVESAARDGMSARRSAAESVRWPAYSAFICCVALFVSNPSHAHLVTTNVSIIRLLAVTFWPHPKEELSVITPQYFFHTGLLSLSQTGKAPPVSYKGCIQKHRDELRIFLGKSN